MIDDDTIEMTIPPGFLRRLVFKMRAASLGDEDAPRDARDNAPWGGHHITLREEVGSRGVADELVAEIDGMDAEHQYELVALMWVGRGDYGSDEWAEAVALAAERADTPAARYLLAHPMAADEIANGLEILGHDRVVSEGAY